MIIRTKSYPRAALIGNPSDGYFGKTIAFVFRNFCAEVQLYETPELEIVLQERDKSIFQSVEKLYNNVRKYGYYGGIRLITAAIKKFYDHCLEHNLDLDKRNFTIRYKSNIPNLLGLAGSSAIITATMKALMQFYSIQIETPILANLVLSVETKELGIGAGLQDRVAQAYEKPVYMDFDRGTLLSQGYGIYKTFDKALLPPLYIAFDTKLAEGSEVVHNDLRHRFNSGDPKVTSSMKLFSNLTDHFYRKILDGEKDNLGDLINHNFDLRQRITQISNRNLEMVQMARSVGATAKFTGSGGAIIGTYHDEIMYLELKETMQKHDIKVIKPEIVE